MKKSAIIVAILLFGLHSTTFAQSADLEGLRTFLKDNPVGAIPESKWADQSLNADDCENAKQLLLESHAAQIKEERSKEWEAKKIEMGDLTMKFDYRTFGDKPENGRSLFISMHGGGGAPARVNDQQWRNQIGLYEPEEGIYLSPRAPTDTWNLWHQGHIDEMFTRIIEDAILLADVDPNRIYLMGYSAGGDGVYQLAPRMADQIAAASMMAGHPNDAKPWGLRNIGFTLHMGGRDAAFKRNEVAREWKKKLAELKDADPEGYQHEVVIHEQHGHWMQRDDAVAVPWMSKFTRNPFPTKVVWYQSGVTHDRYYWLAVDEENKKGGTHVVVTRDGQNFVIEKAEGVSSIKIRFNDEMIDFDQPVTVTSQGKEVFNGKVERTLGVLATTIVDRGDPASVYSGEIKIDLGEE